jgi:hypothetical protein
MNDRLVVAQRIPHSSVDELRSPLENRLRKLASNLEVSFEVEGVTSNDFLRIGVKGPDLEVFTELIRRKLGLAPAQISDLEVNDNIKAYPTGIDAKQQMIEVEIGPVSINFRSEITKEALMAQLCDGRSFPVERVARTFCIQEGVPIEVRITSIHSDRRNIEAWISDDQISRFEEWRRQRYHRIIAVGGLQDRIDKAIRLSKIERDIAEVEELSLMSHMLVCKLGTEAPGIIAKIGRYMGDFKLYAFLPERVDKLRFSTPDRE